GETFVQAFETNSNQILNSVMTEVGKKMYNRLTLQNNFKAMITSGSKGSTVNIGQISGLVGQQNVEGQRMSFIFQGTRTLPHFPAFSQDPEHRGMVKNHYLKGLTPSEFWFHTAGGRDGLIDTALKTSDTGYLQRQLIKSLEDMGVRYDGTVRDSVGNIVEFLYGEDGMDGSRIDAQKLLSLKDSSEIIKKKYHINFDDLDREFPHTNSTILEGMYGSEGNKSIFESEFQRLSDMRDKIRDGLEFFYDGLNAIEKLALPVNVDRLIAVAMRYDTGKRRMATQQSRVNSDLSPLHVIDSVNKLFGVPNLYAQEQLLEHEWVKLDSHSISSEPLANSGSGSSILRDEKDEEEEFEDKPLHLVEETSIHPSTYDETSRSFKGAKTLTSVDTPELVIVGEQGKDKLLRYSQRMSTLFSEYNIRTKLNSKRVCSELKLSAESFDNLIGRLKQQFRMAIVQPGEAIGPIAGQSLGEPTTQMTLNTFHFAGFSKKNVTLGVPRLREIFHVAKAIKTPVASIRLKWKPEEIAEHGEVYEMNYSSYEKLARAKCRNIQTQLQHTTVSELVSKGGVYYDEDDTATTITADRAMLRSYYELFPADESNSLPEYSIYPTAHNSCPLVLRYEFNVAKMHFLKITLGMLAICISEQIGQILRIPRSSRLPLDIKYSSELADTYVMRIRRVSQREEEVTVDEMNELADAISQVAVLGVPGISRVYTRNEEVPILNKKTGCIETLKEWILETEGVDLFSILALDDVDPTCTSCNDLNEVVNVLGIEAARQSIIWECKQCFKESNVNFRHLGLLADLMTHQGHLMSIERHGINRRDTGPIKRATYEEMVEILARAASDGISDDLNGVSQRILLGDVIPLGTGSFDLLLDVEKVISGSSEADAHIMSHQGMDGDAYATALAYDTAHDTAATAMVDRNAEGLDDIQLSGDDGMFGADSAFTATQTALQTANGGIISAGVGYTGAE
ncbi:DNA-directed RNA polymerase II subunit RPB1, partial [Aduncisulcus paluster]